MHKTCWRHCQRRHWTHAANMPTASVLEEIVARRPPLTYEALTRSVRASSQREHPFTRGCQGRVPSTSAKLAGSGGPAPGGAPPPPGAPAPAALRHSRRWASRCPRSARWSWEISSDGTSTKKGTAEDRDRHRHRHGHKLRLVTGGTGKGGTLQLKAKHSRSTCSYNSYYRRIGLIISRTCWPSSFPTQSSKKSASRPMGQGSGGAAPR